MTSASSQHSHWPPFFPCLCPGFWGFVSRFVLRCPNQERLRSLPGRLYSNVKSESLRTFYRWETDKTKTGLVYALGGRGAFIFAPRLFSIRPIEAKRQRNSTRKFLRVSALFLLRTFFLILVGVISSRLTPPTSTGPECWLNDLMTMNQTS